MDSLESLALTYFVNSLWQVALLFAAGWLAARLARRLGPAAEYTVWLCVVALQTVLPALTLFSWQQLGQREWLWLHRLMFWGDTDVRLGAAVTVRQGSGSVLNGPHLSLTLLSTVAALYGMAVAWFAVRFLWSWWRLEGIRREAVPAEPGEEAASAWALCSAYFELPEATMVVSPKVYGPMALGGRRGQVLFPPKMLSGLPSNDLRAALAHECAHLRRNDYVVNFFLQLLALPVGYHPLAAFTRSRLAEAREMVCDQMAAGIAGSKDYARSLLRLAALLLEGAPLPLPHAIGLFDANALERRLMKLTAKQSEMRGARRLAAVLACAACGVGVCGSALALGIHVNAAAAQSDDSAATKMPKKILVSPGIMAGQRIGGSQPKYPEEAKKAKIQGTVVLKALIDKEGKMAALTVKSGPPLLQGSAMDAVKDWTYKPYLLNGDPVEVETEINVTYTLGK